MQNSHANYLLANYIIISTDGNEPPEEYASHHSIFSNRLVLLCFVQRIMWISLFRNSCTGSYIVLSRHMYIDPLHLPYDNGTLFYDNRQGAKAFLDHITAEFAREDFN